MGYGFCLFFEITGIIGAFLKEVSVVFLPLKLRKRNCGNCKIQA
jgi:hypothetical protein